MAINNDRSLLEQQILSNSGLKGKDLESLKTRLASLSEQQLKSELSKLLSGENKEEWYTGLMLEHNEPENSSNNQDKTTYTDDNGNEIFELKDGDEVLERTIKSTDDNGNVYETTVTFSNGKPLTQTKSKNGNTTETTTYKYNDNSEVPFVSVETKKSNQSKVMTNVLEVDENGNFDNEDFIDRKTTSIDGTTTYIYTENNCVIEQQVKPNGKKVDTIYKGDNIGEYDNKKLHRVYQRTELKGEVHEVAYDGNGNTKTVVQNGESPAVIAKKFGVKESSLRRLNPSKGKNAITQVGADIVVPDEYDADAKVMAGRKSKQEAVLDYTKGEVQRTTERLYSSTIKEVTLDRDYKDVYSYAKALLLAGGVKNPSNEQINNKANEILVANGNIKLKKGTKVQIATKTADTKSVQELSNNGFKPTKENAIFYNRFNALESAQQQNVLSVIKYCRSHNITDTNKIKAEILKYYPDINLFDSGKLISMNSVNAPAFQRKNPVALETFLSETLKLDLNSDIGKEVYNRLASLPQERLNLINGSNFGDMSKSSYNDILNTFESSGVNIRTQKENETEQIRRNQRAEKLGVPQQKFTSEMLANIYDKAADMLEQYYHNHGVFDAGTYLEGLKNITDLITPDSLFGIDMRSTMHVASNYRKAAQRFRQMHTDNPETFEKEYAQLKKDGLVTADYNQENIQEFMNLIQSGDVDINSDKFKEACQKAFGFKGVENTEKYIQTGQMVGGIGDIAVMLYTLGMASELKVMGKATTGVYGALEKGAGKIMSKTAAQQTAKIGTSMVMGGTTLGGFTLGKETVNNLTNTMRDATSWETWKESGIASAESFGFGAFGGLLNETVVAPIVKAIEKPATKGVQAVGKALTERSELTGKEIMETVYDSGSLKLDGIFKMNSQEVASLARTASAKGVGFGVEVTGFTAYEAGLDAIKDICDPTTGRLPEDMTVKNLTEYLGEKFSEQFSNLGTIKGISQLLMMSKGGKVAQKAMMNEILSKSEILKDLKFKKAEINGHEVYEVTYPNGNRKVVSSPEQAVATCQMAMQMEFLVKSLEVDAKEQSGKSSESAEVKAPAGLTQEGQENLEIAKSENPEVEAPEVKSESENTLEVKSENVAEIPLLTRLETAKDRESFVAIRDEIKAMPNGEEKTQLMQTYLKKYNEWSQTSERPDVRMEYKPENDETTAPVADETTTPVADKTTAPTVDNKGFIDIDKAKIKLSEFLSEEKDNYQFNYIIRNCSINNQVSEFLLNETITLLKSGLDGNDVLDIIYTFKADHEAIDYNRIKKLHELTDSGIKAEDASRLLRYSSDRHGFYNEDLYNKIMSLNAQDYAASRVLDTCKIDGEIVESTWQKALELNSLGFKNEDIVNVLKSCGIKESQEYNAKTIGFNDELYSKAKLLFEEHKFNPENISSIIESCTINGKFSQECFDKAISLHGKFEESQINGFVHFPQETIDFGLELKNKYNISEYTLKDILRECVSTVDGKRVAYPICMSKVEELMTKYNVKPNDIEEILNASKVDGEFDLKLYDEVIKMHQAGFTRISRIVETITAKGQNDGDASKVNYNLLEKTKEWKALGIEDEWIDVFCTEYKNCKIDVNKHDLVKDYYNVGFEPEEIKNLLAANNNLENLSVVEFRNKVLELKELGLDNDKIFTLLHSIGMPDDWRIPNFKLSKKNLDIVIDMVKRGVKNPYQIVSNSYENHVINQDKLDIAYERIKDGIPEDRLNYTSSKRYHFKEIPELEDVLINLSKLIREDYDYKSFTSLAENVFTEMYSSKNGKELANVVIEVLKNGAKEEDIQSILTTNYDNFVSFNKNSNKPEIISQIKTKLLNALVEHSENIEQVKDIANSATWAIQEGMLDFYLKYPDKYAEIKPLTSKKAKKLMLELDTAGVPIDDILQYTNVLCDTTVSSETIPENIVNKIVELRKNQKLDDNTLMIIRHLPFTEKTPELIDYIIELKEKNLLPEYSEKNARIIGNIVRIEHINSETGKLGLYENYKEILDFYVKNKDLLKLKYYRNVGDSSEIKEFDSIVSNYKWQHKGIDKVLDLKPFEAMAEIVSKTSISPETLNRIIDNGYADKLKTFTEKVDLEKYSNELNLIFEQLSNYYNGNYSIILDENISKRDLEYLLDMQKLILENTKENRNPQLLDNRFVGNFVSEKEIPAEALDKLRYYAEMELADPKNKERVINLYQYDDVIRVYGSSPKNIERIESIIYDKGFDDSMKRSLLSKLSSTPEVLNKQLDLIERILDFSEDLSSDKSSLESNLISIIQNAKTLEDTNAKIEIFEQFKSQLQSKSSLQNFYSTKIKKNKQLEKVLMCVEGTNDINKNVVLAALSNNKYSDLIWGCASSINKNNVALIDDIIKNDRLTQPTVMNFNNLVANTSGYEFKAKYIQENFDKFPQSDLSKISYVVSEVNKDLIIRLYNDKELNFPNKYITDIASVCTRDNINLATRLCTDKNLKCPPDKIVDLLNANQIINIDVGKLSLNQKINAFGTITNMDKTLLNLCRQDLLIDVDKKIAELKVSLGKKKDVITVSDTQQQMFIKNIIANNNQNTETVLKNFDFEQYGKQGLPLKYTREEFTGNIENLIKDLTPKEQQAILEHFGLIRGAAGFDGLPNNKPFNNETATPQVKEIAKKVQNEIETFTAKNQINTGDIVADNVLNGLIDGFPEFTSVVGKVQHGTHAYSVDIHTLKVLQSAMNNPLYEKLSDKDKTILKIAVLCHDLGKRGGVIDTGHASVSAEYVSAILDKFSFPQGMKDRIIDIVENHHWFEAYNTGKATAEDIAARCRRPADFMIYEIFSKADFENVNKDFHISHSEGIKTQAEFDKYMQDKMTAIDEVLTKIYSNANLVFDTQFVLNGEHFPRQTVEIEGEPTELKVLNLNELNDNDSLTQYGFSSGVTKENARFVVHMTAPNAECMEAVMILTQNSLNQSTWSTSLIKVSNNRTYCYRKFGFVMDVDQANIAEASYYNVSSGIGKKMDTFKRILFDLNGNTRTYVKDNFIQELSKKGIELNDNEYAQLTRFLVSKKYTTQISKDIKIGDKVIKAGDLVECLEKSRDGLFESEGEDMHSEIVPINPIVKGLVAKVDKLEDCPEEFLKFAKEHNLPIILMKATDR